VAGEQAARSPCCFSTRATTWDGSPPWSSATLARGERTLAKEASRTAGAHVANLHGAFLGTTGIHQLSDAERGLVTERGLSTWSDCRHLLPRAEAVGEEAVDTE